MKDVYRFIASYKGWSLSYTPDTTGSWTNLAILCCNKYVAPDVTGVIRYKVNIVTHKIGEHVIFGYTLTFFKLFLQVPCRTILATRYGNDSDIRGLQQGDNQDH